MLVYLVDLDSPSELLVTNCFVAPNVCDSAFVALAWLISRSLETQVPCLFLTHTTHHWRISSFVRLVVLSQYNEEDDETIELSAYSALPLPEPSPSPTQIWWVGITPVDAHPLSDVEVCSIFEEDVVSIIEIESPSTPTCKV